MPGNLTDALRRLIRSPAFKFFLIGGLILLLLIPMFMAWGLVQERETRAQGVKRDIARVWGAPQHISGPFLIVPYTVNFRRKSGTDWVEETVSRRAVFLPEQLKIDAGATSKVLNRSIYDVSVFRAELTLSGRFAAPKMANVTTNFTAVRWNEAVLSLGISDASGLKEAATLQINGSRSIPFEPSIGIPSSRMSGIHARLRQGDGADNPPAGLPTGAFSFQFSLALSGSSVIDFTPVARDTLVAMKSDWQHPSFSGAFLPTERKIGPEGFSATWRVPHLARSVPQAWSLADAKLDRFNPYRFGAQFYIPIDFYKLVERATKYGVLFIAVAFMSVFVIELLSGARVHPVQYFFVGLAMIFFYVLLLSLAEHVGFDLAYVLAAGATGIMLSVYVAMSIGSRSQGFAMFAIFLVLYGLLYLILQIADYALLAGAITGFVMLTAAMFLLLRINWSAGTSQELEDETEHPQNP